MEDKKPRLLCEEELDFLRARRDKCFLCKWVVDAYTDRINSAGGPDGAGSKHLMSEAAAIMHVDIELRSLRNP